MESPSNELPQSLLEALPSDPYDQLEVACKITSMAVTARVGKLEAEAKYLQRLVADKELLVSDLQVRVGELQQALKDSSAQLSHALHEQEKLTSEKNMLASTVKKLSRDVLKLESFKKTLMHSLQEEDENQVQEISDDKQSTDRLTSADSSFSSLTPSPDGEINSNGRQFASASANRTPEFTPSGSPKRTPMTLPPRGRSAAVSPTLQAVKGPLKWHSSSDGRLSLPSSMPTSKHSTAPNSPPKSGPNSARTSRVDGKEFFRQARNRLSYEQFSAFLTNIKDLNAHKQSREEALRKAREIFGPENDDMYSAFYGLLHRQLPGQG